MRARLTVHFPDAPARQVPLDAFRRYVLGRNAACDIVINDPDVSRRHAEISRIDDQWTIEDLGSKNGIAVDGAGVDQAALEKDCWISIGQLLARFELRTDEQARADQTIRRRRFDTSLELRRSLSPSAGAEPLLRKLLSSAVHLAGLDRGFAMLARPDGDMDVISAIGVEDVHAFRGSAGAIDRALETGKSVVSMDVQEFVPLADRPSIIAGRIKALICLPMSFMDKTIGMVYADSQTVARVLTELDLEILEGLVAHATTALAVAQLDQEIIDINSIIDKGEIDAAKLSDWQHKVPAYRTPVAGSETGQRDEAGQVTWSKVVAGSR